MLGVVVKRTKDCVTTLNALPWNSTEAPNGERARARFCIRICLRDCPRACAEAGLRRRGAEHAGQTGRISETRPSRTVLGRVFHRKQSASSGVAAIWTYFASSPPLGGVRSGHFLFPVERLSPLPQSQS
ncbi:hypothetical protein HJG60_008384 [Phyllostomus discolor]|uniref:Uncharacterized protein n=1 Tax=Phyllostomus discolor TaxID=89673 RepID=A0A833YX18_9CHIR|nr:hypothetical protein HJG60_008384 [Phyllostomus discolor]